MQNVERLMAIADEPEQEPDEDTRLLNLVGRKRELEVQIIELESQLIDLNDERNELRRQIHELIGLDTPTGLTARNPATAGFTRKCKACGQPGHRARGKLPNGNLFCPENPEGKPLEELNG